MIRDPSDGSVRPDLFAETAKKPAIESGLPLESQKPDRQARLEKSRQWLIEYFKRNPGQGT